MRKITTILFDVGWPIIDETTVHRKWNEHLRKRIMELLGKSISGKDIKVLESDAVTCYAPSLYSYVIWQLVKPDENLFYKLRGEFDSFDFARYSRIQPEAAEIIPRLHGHFKLGLAANQPLTVHEFLNKAGLLRYFTSALVSADIGYTKPDLRMFLKVLENIGSKPEESVMVGDRQDNDIVPARLIGMKTVRLRIGPHRDQKIRFPKEAPDYELTSLRELLSIPFIRSELK